MGRALAAAKLDGVGVKICRAFAIMLEVAAQKVLKEVVKRGLGTSRRERRCVVRLLLLKMHVDTHFSRKSGGN